MSQRRSRSRQPAFTALALAATSAITALTGCASTTSAGEGPLVLLTHDSFALSEGILEQFTEQTGVEVMHQASGDAGQLVNSLVLTAAAPLGDVVFGIDSTFASRVVEAGVLEDYASADLTTAEEPWLLPEGQGREQLTPIDSGDVCVNVDHAWFEENGLPEPETLDDLIDPAYRGLLVVEAANSSSPGLSFLLATIAAYGDPGWKEYWSNLVANEVKIAAGWTDAYYADFSGPSSDGDRPIVVSYASSPPAEAGPNDTEAPTGVLLDTCYRQTEYAGVIRGTKQPAAARQLVDFLFSTTVQNDIPGSMYVFPVNSEATLPPHWAKFAEIAQDPYMIEPHEIDANRERWITEWAAIATP